MAHDRELELALRRQRLVVRNAELRLSLAQQLQPLAAPLALADRIRDLWEWLRGHPEVPLVAAALLVAMRPARALRWASRLWWAWRALQRVTALLKTPTARSDDR